MILNTHNVFSFLKGTFRKPITYKAYNLELRNPIFYTQGNNLHHVTKQSILESKQVSYLSQWDESLEYFRHL